MDRQKQLLLAAIAASTLVATGASAHGLHHGNAAGFLAGLAHPFTGFDHLLAMLAIGIWSVQHGKRVAVWMPAVFAVILAHGAVMASAGHALPGAHIGAAASVALLGVLLASAITFRLPIAFFMVSVFALFHGFSHGSDMSAAVNFPLFGFGLALSTIAIQFVGVGIGTAIERREWPSIKRGFGAVCAVAGAYLLIAH